MSLLEPGRTCWRTARAHRVSVLIDAAAYFSALRAALLRAEHRIMIAGWDVDTRTPLSSEPVPSDGLPVQLLDFLNALLERKPALRVYVLAWDFSVIYALERERLPTSKFAAQAHPRLSFVLDGRHQVGASHHQKLVVVDEQVAFCGGIDLTIRRWDTQAHAVCERLRVDPWGEPYAPLHDVQLGVEGEAAQALSELLRARWQRATGEALGEVGTSANTTQTRTRMRTTGARVHFEEVEVAIARTESSTSDHHRDIREIMGLTLRAIEAARELIFIENQYLTSRAVGEALAKRLREPHGPEIVAILPQAECGWLEQSSMGVLRERLLRRLRAADRHDRLRVYCPVVPGLRGKCVNVHSKVLIVDDRLLKIGSANLSNRSLGLDTECDLALEAGAGQHGERVARGIARVRWELLAEHLGTSLASVEQGAREHGSLIRFIDAQSSGARGLLPLPRECRAPLNLAGLERFVVDPKRPMGVDAFIKSLLPVKLQRPLWRTLLALVILLGPSALLNWAWHVPGSWGSGLMPQLGAALSLLRQAPAPIWYVLAAYVALGAVCCPLTLLVSVTVVAFGPARGGAYALLGSLLSAIASYGVGRLAGSAMLRVLSGPRMSKLRAELRRRAFSATTAARMFPLGNFTLINLLAGALHVPFLRFVAGSVVGLAPGICGVALFSKQLAQTLREPTATHVLILLLCAAAIAALLGLLGWILRADPRERLSGAPARELSP